MLKSKTRPKVPKPVSHAAIGVGAVLVLFALSSWGRPADSDATAFTTVFIAPGPVEAPDKHFVLAPPRLLERLHGLTRAGAGCGPGQSRL